MKNRFVHTSIILVFILSFILNFADAQPVLVKKPGFALKIPDIEAISSSPTHMYVLSSSEGLIVFRAYRDSLEWLYTSQNMQQRGNKIVSDIRFAYLFGNGQRITILEPTSVLGVYSSTTVPAPVEDVHRLGYNLYMAMDSLGIGKISLKTPDAVDSSLTFVIPQTSMGIRPSIIDLEGTRDRLLALGSNHMIYTYTSDKGNLKPDKQIRVRDDINHIFLLKDELVGSTEDGHIYGISQNGNTVSYFSVNEPVSSVSKWNNWYVVRTQSGKLWLGNGDHHVFAARTDSGAGNLFTINKSQLWVSEYNMINRTNIRNSVSNSTTASDTSALKIKPIPNKVVPFPHPVILSLQTEGNYPVKKLTFNYQSHITDAKIHGEGFYWQPGASDIGLHTFTIVATSDDGQVDSTSFKVQVKTFNEPPRFSPVRPQTVPVGQTYQLDFNAVDPDGQNAHLVRYLGVDLPDGAHINEKNGHFTWTPTAQQMGDNSFQVIATDQYGAASSQPVKLTVINANSEEQQ